MRPYLLHIGFIITFGLLPSEVSSQTTDQKPNIIFILADDLGYGDVQALNPDSKIPTPHINSLATQGVLFTNAHSTSSVCSPSRYSFLTGRYSWRTTRKKGVTWVWEGPMIEQGTYTIGQMLKSQGYTTACIGKWHLGLDWPTKDGKPATLQNKGENVDYSKPIQNGPTAHGFDYYFGQEVPSFPPHAFIENDMVNVEPTEHWPASQAGGIEGAMAPGWRYEDQMGTLTAKAVQFIKHQTLTDRKKPFFLYFPLSAPHTPISPHEKFLGKTAVGRYGDFVFEMDYHIGSVIRLVDSLGISKNTLIIVTSDNGGVNEDGNKYVGAVGSLVKKYGHNSSNSLRGIKSDAWEGGHRIPFIVQWKGQVPKNVSSNILISQVDMMATFAAIAGVKLPEEVGEDSYNILPMLKDPSRKNRREFLVTLSGNGILAIQKTDWKLILSSGGGGSWTEPKGGLPELVSNKDGEYWENVQLYNLKDDKGEKHNLASSNPKKVKVLMKILKNYIVNGRSTPGSAIPIKDLWKEVKWIEKVK